MKEEEGIALPPFYFIVVQEYDLHAEGYDKNKCSLFTPEI